jgi:hypothetical protein
MPATKHSDFGGTTSGLGTLRCHAQWRQYDPSAHGRTAACELLRRPVDQAVVWQTVRCVHEDLTKM